MTSVLQTHHLAVGYKSNRLTTVVADHLNLTLQAGEIICLIGQNGVGKSTLMRTLAGMQAPLNGHVTLQGDNLSLLKPRDLAKRMSIVTTERVDVGMMTGYMLVTLGRHPHTDWTGQLSPDDEQVVRWAIQAVGAGTLAERRLNEMSDGERQRMLIARALAQEPAIMLLDEPTAFLDLPRRVEILQLLRDLAHTTHRTILLSTHDLDLALKIADTIWLMSPNLALSVGTPEDLVLNGAFERAFRRDGVQFDPETGSFKVPTVIRGTVRVIGEGVRLIWTKHALQRVGFQIGDSAITIMVTNTGWQVGDTDVTSIQELLQHLP